MRRYFAFLALAFISACTVVGNKPVAQVSQGKKLIIGKVVLQNDNGQSLSADVTPCFKQSSGDVKCGISRFNGAAASVRSLTEMDYVVLEVEPGDISLNEIKLNNFSNSPYHSTFKSGYTSGTIAFEDAMKFHVSENYDVTYFGTIYLATKKIVKVSDEQKEAVEKLKKINQTGKEFTITKDILNPSKNGVKTKINYGLSCLMLLNCKCAFKDCDV